MAFFAIALIVSFSLMPALSTFADTNIQLAANKNIKDENYGSNEDAEELRRERQQIINGGNSSGTNYTDPQQSLNDTINNSKTYQSGGGGGASFQGDCRNVLGMTSWDCGVNISDENSLKSGIWQIVANIATDIIVAGAYLALGYVIYSGYLYMFSNGDSGKVAGAKKSLAHALIGLAMVLSTSIIMGAIRAALLNNSPLNCDVTSGSGCIEPDAMVTSSIQWVIGIAGAVAVIFLVAGGISYITSGGESSKIQKAKQTILYALIGLGIVALAQVITAFVSGTVRDAKGNGAIPTIIAVKSIKEGET